MSPSQNFVRLSRVVTLHDQWEYLGWIEDDALFAVGIEFLVLDDASSTSPGTSLLEEFSRRGIRYHRLERNSGRSIARNTGARLAQGEWIEFVDGDDRPLPLRWNDAWFASDLVLFPVAAHGPEVPEASLLNANHPLLADSKSPTGHRDPRPANTLWRKRVFLELGGFDPRLEPVEDLDLAWRALDRPAAYATAPKQSYNYHGMMRLKNLESTAAFLRFYRRLPQGRPEYDYLVDREVRALWHHATWHLLDHRAYGDLFRKGCVLLYNIIKAVLADLFRRRQ